MLIASNPPDLLIRELGNDALRAPKGGPQGKPRSIAYFLPHGGELLKKPASRVDEAVLGLVRDSIKHMPDHNELIYGIMREMSRKFPELRHTLLCDTAFFSDLPDEAGFYAVPASLRGRGVRRYGSDGLIHQWLWQKMSSLYGIAAKKLITVHLGDRPTMAAIKAGKPADITVGFSCVEGLPSRTSCGDIDASIVFELNELGLSPGEINELLSKKSGFQGMTGKKCGFYDILSPSGAEPALARKILLYDIVKYAGAFASLLEGLDAVAFTADDTTKCQDFIMDICMALGFIGLRSSPPKTAGNTVFFSEKDSKVKAAAFNGGFWKAFSEIAAEAEKENI